MHKSSLSITYDSIPVCSLCCMWLERIFPEEIGTFFSGLVYNGATEAQRGSVTRLAPPSEVTTVSKRMPWTPECPASALLFLWPPFFLLEN